MTDQSPPELGKQSGGRYQLNGVGMPQNTERDDLADVLGRWGHLTVHVATPEAVATNRKMLLARADAILAAGFHRG